MRRALLALLVVVAVAPIVRAQQPVVTKAVDSGTAATTDVGDGTNHAFRASVWFGGSNIDPRDVSDRAGRLLGQVSFGAPQHVIVDTAPTTAVTGTFWPTTAGAPSAVRVSNGVSFVDPTQIRALTSSDQVTIANSSIAVTGTFWQATQPVSGTVTANAGSGTFTDQHSNITVDYDTGAGTQTMTMFGVALPASGGAVAGGTATNPFRIDPTGTTTQPVSGTVTANAGSGTFAVSATSLPLPTGAATSAKQPALGTAGSASSDVLTVQGITSMTPLKVDGSGVTQPISAASLPLPTGAATAANQPAIGTAGTPAADVLSVQGVTNGTPLDVNPQWQNAEATGTLNANGQTFTVALAGYNGAGAYVTGPCTCSFTYEFSYDNGTSWSAAVVVVGGAQNLGTGVSNPAGATDAHFIVGEHWTHVRLRVTAYTSGTPSVWVHATTLLSPLAIGALATGSTLSAGLPFWVQMVGTQNSTTTPGRIVQCDKTAQATITTATTTALVAVSGSTKVYVCGYTIQIQGVATTAGTLQLEYGSGAACVTGPTAITPTYIGSTTAGNPTTITDGGNLGYAFVTPAAQGLCAVSTTTTTQKVFIRYAQF